MSAKKLSAHVSLRRRRSRTSRWQGFKSRVQGWVRFEFKKLTQAAARNEDKAGGAALAASQLEAMVMAKRIRRLEIQTDRLVRSMLGGAYQSVFKGRGMMLDEVREYQEGDDIRAIDWNVTARMDRLFVKKYVEERELTVILAVDVSASLDFATAGSELKRDLAARLAMTVALAAIANHDRVGLYLFDKEPVKFIPPRRGRQHGLRLVRELMGFAIPRTPVRSALPPMASALSALRRLLKQPATIFLCSDFLSADFEALRSLTARHDVIAVTLTDPAEERLPDLGRVQWLDPETRRCAVFDTSDPVLRAKYEQKMAQRRRDRQAVFAALGIDEVELKTGGSFLRPVVSFFRQRGNRRIRRRAR